MYEAIMSTVEITKELPVGKKFIQCGSYKSRLDFAIHHCSQHRITSSLIAKLFSHVQPQQMSKGRLA